MEFPWRDREAIRRHWYLILNTATDIAQFPQLGDNLMLCAGDLLQAHAAANLLETLFDASLQKPSHSRSSFVSGSRAEKMKLSAIFRPRNYDYAVFISQREHFSSNRHSLNAPACPCVSSTAMIA